MESQQICRQPTSLFSIFLSQRTVAPEIEDSNSPDNSAEVAAAKFIANIKQIKDNLLW